ncbi:MAG: phospholipid carrier-dependent glycosyltransferase [Candidatus Limivivens sp.]|nr:phospholipid carrier-dependent glycosyltransferase [Candidatus Limivivens sp.]
MTSVYFAVGITLFLYWIIFLARKKTGLPDYSKAELVIFWLLTRVMPICMLSEKQFGIWRNFLLELPMLALIIFLFQNRQEQKIRRCYYACYLFQPYSILAILSGSAGKMLPLFGLLLFMGFCDAYMKKRDGNLLVFLPEYLLECTGVFCWFTAAELFGQRFSDIFRTEEIPMLYVLALALIGIGIVRLILRLIRKDFPECFLSRETEKGNGCFCEDRKSQELKVKDLLLMIFFTVSFAAVVFFRLGSFRVPETFWKLEQGQNRSNEIVLGFDREVNLSKIYIYLGYNGKRVMSFSLLNSENTEWNIFDSKHTVQSAFCWNEVSVNQPVETLGIVLLEGSAYIHEIVCLDSAGNRILPKNAAYYGSLFDEQGLFPEKRTYYDQTMFDEVYHARTAYEFLNELPIYENTHPPLGKSIISLGIRAFGANPFGWRVMCALLGTLMVPVLYLFAHRIFRSTTAASFATILLCTEFMHFTLSRIATLDILVAFFVLLMFYFMYLFVSSGGPNKSLCRQMLYLFLCGCSMALAVSTKWTGVYAAAGIAVLFFVSLWEKIGGKDGIQVHKRYLIYLSIGCCVFFIAIPLTVYVLSYIPFTKVYTDKGLLQAAIDNAKLMFGYHVDTVFEHPYLSEWYEWLVDRKPLLDSYTVLEDGYISTIATFGNPLVWWGGLIALVHQFYLWRVQKCKNARYLILAYFSTLLPWLFIHRTVFIYQYYLSSMTLILMIGNSVVHLKKGKKIMILLSVVSISLFFLFYPVISGSPVKADYVNQVLEWMHTWKFALG